MAFQRYQQPPILVEISDRVIGATTVKRKVQLSQLLYQQSGNATTVILYITVQLFAANADGSYGEALSGHGGFQDYQDTLVADNSQIVDPATGAIIGDAALMNDPASFQVGGALANDKAYMYEGEFFRQLAATQAVAIDPMITGKIQNADAIHRFDR